MARRRRARGAGGASPDEAFRVVRSNLQGPLADLERRVVVVTSADAGDGRTAVAVGLARAFARSGGRVVLVDLDLRHPDAHRVLGAHNERGATDVMVGRRTLEECVQPVEPSAGGDTGLYFLGAGEQVGNPADLLGTSRAAGMVEDLSAQYDLVLLDSPPVLAVADTLVIARLAGAALLVVEQRRTPLPTARKAKDLLERNQACVLGVVLNRADRVVDTDGDRTRSVDGGDGDEPRPP